jgi:hypothetical protein
MPTENKTTRRSRTSFGDEVRSSRIRLRLALLAKCLPMSIEQD